MLRAMAIVWAGSSEESTGSVEGLADVVRDKVPAWLLERFFLLELWQWIGLGILAFLGVMLDRGAIRVFGSVLQRVMRDSVPAALGAVVGETSDLRDTIARTLRPIGLLAAAAVWWLGIQALDLLPGPEKVLGKAAQVVALAAGLWCAFRVVDLLAELLIRKAQKTNSKVDDLLVPLVRKSAKVFLLAFGLVFVADNLGTDVSSLLAGLGLGGLAFALAAQDTVKNLFGTVTILLDRTYNVGDWIVVGDVEGTVEHVGFRTTKIRTFYHSLVSVPNSTLITASVDNLGLRGYRRWKTLLSIEYSTPPDKIEALCEGIRELVRRHPYTRKDSFQVYLHEFGASSLNLLLYVFHAAPDWSTELRERHRLMLDVLRLSQSLGVRLAFPTQTLHVRLDEEDERSSATEAPDSDAEVRAMRRQGRAAAREIVVAALGDPPRRPPPVNIAVDEEEDRGA